LVSDSPTWRWLSDSAYWIYLIHLPVVTAITFVMFGISIPVELKFLAAIVLTSLIGIATYKYLVRGTVIGVLLNGRRYKRS
jgi:peptidoglycan/LPS O-acetylase OafA/YrhL